MNRVLQVLNLVGVLALAALCVLQWRANRAVNLEATGLEKIRLDQAARLAEQEKSLKGLTADLDAFRDQLGATHENLRAAEAKVATLERDTRQLTAERDQLKAAVEKWAEAVAARDARLAELDRQVRQLAADRNDAVRQFNELAEKYNAVVKDLNEARARRAGPSTNAPPRTP
jgi:chromosome segregation ATPase